MEDLDKVKNLTVYKAEIYDCQVDGGFIKQKQKQKNQQMHFSTCLFMQIKYDLIQTLNQAEKSSVDGCASAPRGHGEYERGPCG